MSWKILVLNSGGVDSTTCVAIAIARHGKENVSTVSFYYGQKHQKELQCAERIAARYGVKNYRLDLSNILKFSDCPLLAGREAIKHESYAEQIAKNGEGMVDTYVPFRNGLMLSAVAALAMSIYPKENVKIFIGAHADDAAGNAYADCSAPFMTAMSSAIFIGTYEKVSVMYPLIAMNKTEVVRVGLELGAPYDLTWSCYEGNEEPCHTCGTCIDRENAFENNGVRDPIIL